MLGSLLSPAGRRARLTILIYHRVLERPDPLLPNELDAEGFGRRMAFLAGNFKVLPLLEAVSRLKKGSLPARALCITFDDGYANNAEVALPILQRFGLTATFFVATGYLEGGMMWNDKVIEVVRQAPGSHLDLTFLGLDTYPVGTVEQRRSTIFSLISALKYRAPEEREAWVGRIIQTTGAEIPTGMMMRAEQARALYRAGMEIGGHTVSHPILARLPFERARAEIAEGKAHLESIIGDRVRVFAYPNGRPGVDYSAEHVAAVKEAGFEAAVSTAMGSASLDSDIYQLPRFSPWSRSLPGYVAQLIGNSRNVRTQAV